MTKIKYREYKDSDFYRLLSFLSVIDQDFYPSLSERMALIDYLNNDLKNPSVTILAEIDGGIVGFINLQLNDPNPNECYINTIAVAPESRKFGIGSELLKRTIKTAKKLNYKNLKTRTWSINNSGLGLYKKFGFITDYIVKNDRADAVDTIYLLKGL
jgi:ribosomal-protein-alanine N-acetyltransferase